MFVFFTLLFCHVANVFIKMEMKERETVISRITVYGGIKGDVCRADGFTGSSAAPLGGWLQDPSEIPDHRTII